MNSMNNPRRCDPDNAPEDEPSCGKHGNAHMYDDGHVVECVECLLIEKREMLLQIDVQKAEAEKWKSAADALGRRADIAEMNCDTLQANAKRHREERDHYREKSQEYLRLYSELQERFGVYGQHLKHCVVHLFPEIPCDCGFLTHEVKRNDGLPKVFSLKCPTCGEVAEITCKCFMRESQCKNGHEWHSCYVHGGVVLGRRGLAHDDQSCSCS